MTSICPDSVMARVRQGAATEAEKEQLHAHLAHCEACRVSLKVGRDFDRVLVVQPQDALIASRVAATLGRRSARRRARMLVWPIAAALAVSSVAAGSRMPFVRRALDRLFPSSSEPKPTHVFEAHSPVAVAPAPVILEPDAPAVAEREEAPPRITRPPKIHRVEPKAPAPIAAVAEPVQPTATELFAQANGFRRAGELERALSSYLSLQSRYPASVEAIVSQVSLGRLVLERRDDPAQALRHFEAYLAQSSHSALTEEALFGKANALSKLGRFGEERQAWQTLLSRYPDSVYAERARARLGTAPKK